MQYSIYRISKPIVEAMNNRVAYEGICRECLGLIKVGEGYRFRDDGMQFHARCVERHNNSYYIRLERRRAESQRAGQ